MKWMLSTLVALTPATFGQSEVAILEASDGRPDDWFGYSMDLQDGVAFVGAPGAWGGGVTAIGNPPTAEGTGAVYIFEEGPNGWAEVQVLHPSQGRHGARFGYDLAVDGDWLVVGAPEQGSGGTAYLFERTPNGWVERASFTGPKKYEYGTSVAIDGDRVLVGAPKSWSDWASFVEVIERVGGVWSVVDQYAGLARVVELKGDRSFGGDPYRGAGATYVWTANGWQEEQVLEYFFVHSWYGTTALLRDDLVLVGEPYNGFTGQVFRYEWDGVAWSELDQQQAPEDPYIGFAYDIDEADGLVVVGDVAGGWAALNDGAAYAYELVGQDLVWSHKLIRSGFDPTSPDFDWFGLQVATDGHRVLVSAPDIAELHGGRVHVFEVLRGVTHSCVCEVPLEPCGNPYPIGGCRNSREQGALLGARGTASVASDDLVLTCSQVPPHQFGLVCMSDTLAPPTHLADGLLCLGGNVQRLPMRATGVGGSFDEGEGILARAQSLGLSVQPGDTWHFQAWARDPGGPCGLGSNLSQVLSVTFAP